MQHLSRVVRGTEPARTGYPVVLPSSDIPAGDNYYRPTRQCPQRVQAPPQHLNPQRTIIADANACTECPTPAHMEVRCYSVTMVCAKHHRQS